MVAPKRQFELFPAQTIPSYHTFSAPRCTFPDVGGKLVDVTYEPVGCKTELNNENCRAIHTCKGKSATCTCTQDNSTNLIECSSESVTDLLMNNCDTTGL